MNNPYSSSHGWEIDRNNPTADLEPLNPYCPGFLDSLAQNNPAGFLEHEDIGLVRLVTEYGLNNVISIR